MSRLVSEDQIQRLLEGIEQGLSRLALAKHAGVCEKTAVSYRRMYEENIGPLPALCGCGRPLKHLGFCRSRRAYQVEEKKS